jgi:hypothetical protein
MAQRSVRSLNTHLAPFREGFERFRWILARAAYLERWVSSRTMEGSQGYGREFRDTDAESKGLLHLASLPRTLKEMCWGRSYSGRMDIKIDVGDRLILRLSMDRLNRVCAWLGVWKSEEHSELEGIFRDEDGGWACEVGQCGESAVGAG